MRALDEDTRVFSFYLFIFLCVLLQSKPRTEKVEHATEEEPSEVFIKEEITLDIPFAVQVLIILYYYTQKLVQNT